MNGNTSEKKNDDAGYYFGSAKFIYPNDGKLYLLGGYGYYRTKKDLFSYDFVKKDWQIVKLKKNEMTPRAWFTFGKAFNDGEFFIYGGFGNENGNQELGFNSFYDLFLLNMNDSTITKLKLPKEQKFSYSYLFNNLYPDTKDSSIYFLSMREESKSFTVSLNKLDLKTGDITTVGNKFWKTNEHSWLYASLNYSKSTNEFIAAIFFNGKYELFSINYPPISETLTPAFQEVKQTNHTEIIIFTVGGIFLIILVIVYYNKRKVKSNKIGEPINSRFNIDYSFTGAKNSIKLFGGFHLYDKDSKDISATLSPKLKEIFLLLLIKSFINHRGGITSEELSSTIWPDASPESAKTNRGVAINKIRKFLSNVEGITIEFSDKLWQIKINNSANCDYAEYLKYYSLFKAENTLNGSLLNSVLNVLAGGEFLRGISYEWLDSIKFAINIEVIGFLKSFLESPEIKNDPEKIIRICDTILLFDIVEQDALKIKLRTLTETGKIHIAKSSFNLFVADYKKLYDEKFPHSFDEFIAS